MVYDFPFFILAHLFVRILIFNLYNEMYHRRKRADMNLHHSQYGFLLRRALYKILLDSSCPGLQHTMPRFFIEFVNLQRRTGTQGKDSSPSITVTLKLFSNSLPNTTDAVARLFFSEDANTVTYRKSQVTRVIAPEYLIQFGRPVRRSKSSVEKLGSPIDVKEYRECEAKFTERVRGRRGLVCVATRPGDMAEPDESIELCVVFVPWGEYPELAGYVVVGECKEWLALRKWMSAVDVQQEASTGSWETPTGKGVWVNRCGRLQEKDDSTKSTPTKVTGTGTNVGEKRVKAVDVLFKKQRVG